MADRIVDVVAGVLLRPDGAFFMASRPEGKVYAGYWEFPGGKVEPGEARYAALVRELHEELGIEVQRATPWLTQVFAYPHATVRLNFFLVHHWLGAPHPKEGQQFAWQTAGDLSVSPVLPANTPIFRALALPAYYAITNAGELGVDEQLRRLDSALSNGVRLIQVREKQLPMPERLTFAKAVVALARPHQAKVFFNGSLEEALEVGADGLHLTSTALHQYTTRPAIEWVGASCHHAADLLQAKQLGVDYALLGSVLPTLSHPDGQVLGWDAFRALHAEGWPLPIYALGGMTPTMLADAQGYGAHGVAMQRQIW
ncbi:8-oxo-dGTP diphosphatase [Chitinivorax tropicus]|uniref:8-oxo-dGTP diphosphatase n=1 Tax=Chitinivorax tropicus TaxID=714531 RepID=A0A840MKY7_9PROT|nr:Nudix family hydrolase [Chitinivorax tropicus]MBB5017372.1 8-oxo-dGTP diphosphatase [Chitinivorax tropicus]